MRRFFSLVILAILGFIGSGVFPAYADTNISDQKKSSARVTITSVGNPTIREGEKLRVEALVSNTGDSPLTFDAELRTHSKSFSTRTHLLAFIGKGTSGQDSSVSLSAVARAPKPFTVAARSQTSIVFEADTSAFGWTAQNWGPRGVEVLITSAQGDKANDRSFIVVAPAQDVTPVPTGIVVPLTDSREELADLYTADDMTRIHSQPSERIKNLAATMSMSGVSVIADPDYADLSQAPQTILSATADANILGLLDAHREDLAQSLTEKTFKKGSVPVWVNTPGSAEAFAAYSQLGASAFILDSSLCTFDKKGYATPATHTLLELGGSSVDLLLDDAESSRIIVEARDSLQARQNALALSAMTYLEQPSVIRPQLLYFDVSGNEIWKVDTKGKVVRDYSQLAEASSALMDAPWVQAAQLSDLLATPTSSSVRLSSHNPRSGEVLTSVLTKHNLDYIDASVAAARVPANLVATPEKVLDPVDTAAAYLYSQNWNGDEEAYGHALDAFSVLCAHYGNSVSATSVSTINLVAEQADIPVHVQNKLSVPATVTVSLDSVDARLSAKESVTVEIPPTTTSSVSIPVNARGSGNVQAKIRLYDAQGNSVGMPVTMKVRVRAGWENTATVVAGIVAGLLLVVGIIRSIKGGRRSGPVNPQAYTQTRRNADLALSGHSKKLGVPPHNSP